MTIQTCCGGILSNNRDVTESEAPYMFRKCLRYPEDWNKVQCSEDCCEDGGYCTTTENGGYCKDSSNRYYYYRNNEKIAISGESAHNQYPYHHSDVYPYPRHEGRHHFDDRRYDRSYAQAQKDLLNEYREYSILHQDTSLKKSITEGDEKLKDERIKDDTEVQLSPYEKVIIVFLLSLFITISIYLASEHIKII
jgi:hypothetical protein